MAGPFSLLVYDIPEVLHLRNPSKELRRYAVRVNLSCWVLPDSAMPHHLLSDWTATGIRWHVVPFAMAAEGQILEIATAAIRQEIDRLLTSLRDSEESAGEMQDPAGKAAYWPRARAALSQARRLLRDAESCALSFQLSTDSLAITSGWQTLRALDIRARARAAAYSGMTDQLAQIAGSEGLVLAGRADELPALIGADVLDEAGLCHGPVRTAFAE